MQALRVIPSILSRSILKFNQCALFTTTPINFVSADGKTTKVEAKYGDSLLEVAKKNKIPLEGACDGSLACSTCHVILEQSFYDKLPEKTEDEMDMLDLAKNLTDTSRLGCQLKVDKSFENVNITLPPS